MSTEGMTVAVTGPTRTFGVGLMPLLQADNRISRIIGIARRPFDPAEQGWTKMHYIRGDVRDPGSLERAPARPSASRSARTICARSRTRSRQTG